MYRKMLSEFFNDFKSVCLSYKDYIRNNTVFATIIILCYGALFFIDPFIREWSLASHTEFLDKVFSVGHWYGKFTLTFLTIAILSAVGLVFKNKRIKKAASSFAESFLISGIIVTIIKSLFGRWRPYTEHGNMAFFFVNFGPNEHLSLPSGDVAIAFAYSIIAASLFESKVWKIFCFSMAVLTAAGRIYHDQHWLTDVIAATFISVWTGKYLVKKADESF